MKAIVSAMSVMVAVCILDGAWAGTWYVDVSVPKAGDGTSWEKALEKIQAGINKAADGDTVIVAQGTYVENIQFKGKNLILTSTNPLNWNTVASTVIDANKSGSVVRFAGTENQTCVLSGFTIRNGAGTWIAQDANFSGGGILGVDPAVNLSMTPFTHATIQNNIITSNSADIGAGVDVCDGLIRNNIIIGNSGSASGTGGGIGFCHGTIESNSIVGNSSMGGGGIAHSNAVFRNNVVVANIGFGGGGGLVHLGTSEYGPPGGAITNCIIWGNSSPTDPQIHNSLPPTYSCIQDWTGGGEGNRSGDPRFVDADGPDDDPNTFEDNEYRLLSNSPCIDAGTNEDWMNGATELDGKPRILLGATSLTVDMGAYEYRFDFAIARNPESDVELSWVMRPARTYTVLSSFDMMLQTWGEETTIFGGRTGGPAVWVDPSAASPLKFYKIQIE